MAQHNFSAAGGHAFKIALFTSGVTLDETTTVYSATGEAGGTAYVAGGFALTNVDPSISGTTAMATFSANPTWTSATFTASQALIYNTSSSNKAVVVLDFGGTQTVSAGDFVITLPAVTSTTALLRLT
jgi:anaerobic selenocysteine-containing dehydrogenase